MSKRWDRARFKCVSQSIGGSYQRAWQAICRDCSEIDTLPDASKTGLPPEFLAKKFTSRGWIIGATATRDLCPTCAVKIQLKVIPMKAEAPIQPTRHNRRSVIDALEEHYDARLERYNANWSDKALAAKINMPTAWVAEERERAYGPDVNEAINARSQAVSGLEKRLGEIEDATLKALDDMRAEINKLKIDISYKAA